MTSRQALLLASLAGAACTLEAGDPFATLEPQIIAALDQPADRVRPEGWLRLSSDYEVRFTTLTMTLAPIELYAGGGAALGFDPSRPPAGYSLCHSGHCHHESGRLVPYDEIAADLSGGAAARPVLTLQPPVLDFVAGTSQALGCAAPCDLPIGRITRLRAPVRGLRLEGLVRDTRAPARLAGSVPFAMSVALAGQSASDAPALTGELDLPVDRTHDPAVALTLRPRVGPLLFDAVDWAALGADGMTIDLDAPAAAPTRTAVLKALAESPLGVTIVRSAL